MLSPAFIREEVHQAWGQKQLAAALFLDIVGAFDRVDPARLGKRMEECGLDGDLRRWTQSFLANRKILLVIDGHQGPESAVTGLPQGSLVSPILFVIYISGIFEAIERAVPGVRALSFADDIGLIGCRNSVDQVCSNCNKRGR